MDQSVEGIRRRLNEAFASSPQLQEVERRKTEIQGEIEERQRQLAQLHVQQTVPTRQRLAREAGITAEKLEDLPVPDGFAGVRWEEIRNPGRMKLPGFEGERAALLLEYGGYSVEVEAHWCPHGCCWMVAFPEHTARIRPNFTHDHEYKCPVCQQVVRFSSPFFGPDYANPPVEGGSIGAVPMPTASAR